MDDNIASFISITGASTKNAESYLRVADGGLPQAIQLFFEMNGADMDIPASSNAPAHSAPSQPSGGIRNEPIAVDDDDDMIVDEEDDDFRVALEASQRTVRPPQTHPAPVTTGSTRSEQWDDDEAMARRLQEEFYSESGGGHDTNGVRAPIARTTETLVGPDEDFLEQMAVRTRGTRTGAGRPGIFNPRPPPVQPGVWDNGPRARQAHAMSTNNASEQSAKHLSLAEMYRPPYEIIEHLEFEEARDQAKELKKWILVNIQDTSIFDCQVLNRDIWKAKEVKDTIKENFLFLQYDKTGIDGQKYVRLYFPHAIDVPPTSALNPFPIIAIIDPRTGEQVKVWTETPKKPLEFVMQLLEFLDRYSLDNTAKNPVQKPGQNTRKLDVDHMTEDEMLDWALRNSLGNVEEPASVHHDPDELTREGEVNLMEFDDVGPPAPGPAERTPFQAISKTKHHMQPPMGTPGITRIQFKLADGSRVVRRFALGDKVSRLYEWIKADLLPEQAAEKGEEVTEATSDKQFELVSMGKNLIDRLDSTLEEAQLKMGTVMIEFVDSE